MTAGPMLMIAAAATIFTPSEAAKSVVSVILRDFLVRQHYVAHHLGVQFHYTEKLPIFLYSTPSF